MSATTDDPEPARPARGRRRGHRVSWSSQLLTFGLALGMMISAFVTYQAVPGDTLYPLKRAAESALLRMSTDDVERGERELASAEERAQELDALLDSPEGGPHVGATIQDMAESTRSAISRLTRAEPRSKKIDRFAKDQHDIVEPLMELMEPGSQDKADSYLRYIDGLAAPE